MVDRNELTTGISDWIFQNTNVLQEQKKETDQLKPKKGIPYGDAFFGIIVCL
jgi:hypothetical protein